MAKSPRRAKRVEPSRPASRASVKPKPARRAKKAAPAADAAPATPEKRPARRRTAAAKAPERPSAPEPAPAAPAPPAPASAPVATPASKSAAPFGASLSDAVPPPPPSPPSAPESRVPLPPRIPIPPLPDDEMEGFEPIVEPPRGTGRDPRVSEQGAPAPFDEEGFVPIPESGYGGGEEDEGPDDFVPIEVAPQEEPAREAPAGASPIQLLDMVRRGELHVAALAPIPDADIASVAARLGYSTPPGEARAELLVRLLHRPPDALRVETYATEGLLELFPDGYGFLRRPETGYVADPGDAYVPGGIVRRLGLQVGHWVSGTARKPRPGEKYPAMLEVLEVNHEDPEVVRGVVPFDQLTVTHPDHRFLLETTQDELAMRLMDLFCPLGRGQRALIVSPPRAGKTILLQKLADSLARNSPEVEIVVLLVDERPEEVTNMRRAIRGEVIASTFDYPAHRHIRVAELVMEKVKRMVELGRHVVLLLDSLTRLGRAYNNETGGGGRLLTGGLEASALTKPKRFFGAARNIEHGGSLTIIATALVDTGSRLDQVIFEEFKGTGNMEVALSRELANQRIWPAIDLAKSGTRKEELLLHPEEQRRVVALRREMQSEDPAESLAELLERMSKYATNAEFLMHVQP